MIGGGAEPSDIYSPMNDALPPSPLPPKKGAERFELLWILVGDWCTACYYCYLIIGGKLRTAANCPSWHAKITRRDTLAVNCPSDELS